MAYLSAAGKGAELLWFFDTERDEPSINVCGCGEAIPEEVGYCEECSDWGEARRREKAYRKRLMEASWYE